MAVRQIKLEVGQMVRLVKASIAHKVRLSATPPEEDPQGYLRHLGFIPQIKMHAFSIIGEGFASGTSFMFLGSDESRPEMIDLGYARGIFLHGESVYLIYLRDFGH